MNDQQNTQNPAPQGHEPPNQPRPSSHPGSKKKKPSKKSDSRALWMFAAVFVLFLVVTMLNRTGPKMNWATSYEQALLTARQTGKPLMVVMYKEPINHEYTRLLFDETFSSEAVIIFVEENFIPVKMNVLDPEYKQVSEALEYNYEPTTVVLDPETEKVIKRRVGNDPEPLFIAEFSEALKK